MRRTWAVVLAAAAAACRAPSSVASYPDAPVVLISIDTLRADRVPAYGYAAGSTPHLDRLAREGVVFQDVYSHCPLTVPAHASMLTGLLPPRHGLRDNLGYRLSNEHRTLATRFKAAGRETGGAVSAYVMRAATGLAQGFDFYEDALVFEAGKESLGDLQRDGAVAVAALGRWLESRPRGARFFAFLHLYEPHAPYAPPERHRGHRQAYDGEIAYADELVGRLFDVLTARGLYDGALIAVTSDHGEGLLDHGEAEHGMFLYREAVRVPLIVRLPGGLRGGGRVAGAVAQADLAATLLDLAGLPSEGTDGVSLRGALFGMPPPARTVYSETLFPRLHFGWSELYAVTDDRYRYVKAPRAELFDLTADPGEKKNLAGERRSVLTAMDAWLQRHVGAGPAPAPEEVPGDVRERLQALGYLGAAGGRTGRPLADPKDRIASYEEFRRGVSLRLAGKLTEAAGQLRSVVTADAHMPDAWEMLGLTLIDLERVGEGIAALDRAVALNPGRAEGHLALAKAHGLEGRPEAAIRHARLAATREPAKAHEILAQLLLGLGRTDEAAESARRSSQADPRRVMSHFVLGVVAQRNGRYEEALGAFRRAEAANRLQSGSVVLNLHANMADCLARLGRVAEAEREFLAELRAIPWSGQGRVGLAMLYRSQGRHAEGRSTLAGLIAAQPRPNAEAYWTVVRTFTVLGDEEAAREWASRARAQFPNDPRFRRRVGG